MASMCAAPLLDRGAMTMAEDVVVAEVAAAGHRRRRRRSVSLSAAAPSSASLPSIDGGGGVMCACVPASAAALSTLDGRCTLPDMLPLGDVAWPDEVLAVWRTMRYSSLVGVFASLSRVWLTVDHTLLLWDYRTRRELCVYAGVPELIVAVGTPVRPRRGVFAPHIAYVLPVATASMCLLLGLCVTDGIGSNDSSNDNSMLTDEEAAAAAAAAAATAMSSLPLRIVDLDCCVATPQTLLTRLVGDVDAGRIFVAGADGNVYELTYHATSTLLAPRVRLVCYNAACRFAPRMPLLSPLASLARALRQTWTGATCAGVRDMAVDHTRKLLFTLDERSVVVVWAMTNDGLRWLQTLPAPPLSSSSLSRGDVYDVARQADRAGDAFTTAAVATSSRPAGEQARDVALSRLFVIDADVDGCTLVAVAVNGDQLRYRQLDMLAAYDNGSSSGGVGSYGGSGGYSSRTDSSSYSCSSSNMVLHSYVRAPVPAGHVVHVCLATDTALLLAHSATTDGDDTDGGDNAIAATTTTTTTTTTTPPDELVAVTMPTVVLEPLSPATPHHHGRVSSSSSQPRYDSDYNSSSSSVATTACCVATWLRTPASRVVRVDAMAPLPDAWPRPANELCAQVTHAPARFVVAHRHGLAAYAQSRPVDTLYGILACSAHARTRAALLRRFAAGYSAADYACMLLQIAAGALRVGCDDDAGDVSGGDAACWLPEAATTTLGARRASAAATVAATTTTTTTLEQLGATVACGGGGTATVVRRAARELLCGLTQLSVERDTTVPVTTTTAAGAAAAATRRHVTLSLSPFVQAVLLYTARACYALWDSAIGSATATRLRLAETALSLLLRFVPGVLDDASGSGGVTVAADAVAGKQRRDDMYAYDACRDEATAAAAWPTDVYTTSRAYDGGSGGGRVQPYCSVLWQRGRVKLTLAPDAELSAEYVQSLHVAALHAALTLASRAHQLATLLRHTRYIALPPEEQQMSFGLLVRDAAAAQRVGRCLTHILLAAPLLGGSHNNNNNSNSSSNSLSDEAATVACAEGCDGVSAVSAAQLRAFRALQQRCAYAFSADDVQALIARNDLLQLTSSLRAHDATAHVAQWVARVAPDAAAYSQSGALQGICRQLCACRHDEAAVRLLLHAARQLDVDDACLPLYEAEYGSNSSRSSSSRADASMHVDDDDMVAAQVTRSVSSNNSSVTATTYQHKMRLLELVVTILERAWQTNRAAAERLLGNADVSGTLWRIEPRDVVAHYVLLDWLAAPRDDAAVTRHLRATLVAAASPHVAAYLARRAATLGDVYAQYLRCRKHDDAAAAAHSVALAQSPLSHLPRDERLPYRLRCLGEAVACARRADTAAVASSSSSSLAQIEQRLALLHAQQRLYRIVDGFAHSQLPQLERQWRLDDGRVRSERDMAHEHAARLCDALCSASELLQLAGMYTRFGGAEVQLDVLTATHVSDAAMYATCVARVYAPFDEDDDDGDDDVDVVAAAAAQRARDASAVGRVHHRGGCSSRDVDDNVDDMYTSYDSSNSHRRRRDAAVAAVTRRLLQRYYTPAVSFPLAYVVRWLEAYHYVRAPHGSRATVHLLLRDCHVDVRVLFHTYETVLRGATAVGNNGDNDEDDDDAAFAMAGSDVMCERYERARVSSAYLLHSLAVVLLHMAHAARKGTVAAGMLLRAMHGMRAYVAQTATQCAAAATTAADDDDDDDVAMQRRALAAAERVLRSVDEVARDVRGIDASY